jgi:hypothetical protein
MPVRVVCPNCRKVYNLRDEFAGKKLRCANPGCHREFVATPDSPDEEEVEAVEVVDEDESTAAPPASSRSGMQSRPGRVPAPPPASGPRSPGSPRSAPPPRTRRPPPARRPSGGGGSGGASLAVILACVFGGLFILCGGGGLAAWILLGRESKSPEHGPVAMRPFDNQGLHDPDLGRPRKDDAENGPAFPPGGPAEPRGAPGGLMNPPGGSADPRGGPPGGGVEQPGGIPPAPGGGPVKPSKNPGGPAKPPRAPNPIIQPPTPVAIKPPVLDQDRVVRQLPSTIGDVCGGGGGRFLILYLPQVRKLAIFDANEAKVVKYLDFTEDGIKFAAGMDKLIVALPDSGSLQRWNLLTFERETMVRAPLQGTVTALCMGSASNGPLLCQAKGSDQFGGGQPGVLLDPLTFKEMTFDWLKEGQLPHFTSFLVRASANGQVFGFHDGAGGEPHALKTITLKGGQATVNAVWPAPGSLAVPAPDGRFVYLASGVYNTEFRQIQPKEGGGRLIGGPWLPAEHGSYFMHLEPAGEDVTGRPPGNKAKGGSISFFLPGNDRPFARVNDIEGVAHERIAYGNPEDKILFDRRVHFIPDAKLLVTIPPTNDRLLVYRLDIEQELEKSGIDYLLVMSQPEPRAKKGDTYTYQLEVKSKKGGVKYKLESGPDGMTLDGKGKLTWKVPADFGQAEANVIISVGDSTGQEAFHTFNLAVE